MANRFWIAGSTQNFNDTTYWSDVTGGSGGFSVPGPSDTAYFDGNGLGGCTLTADLGSVVDNGGGDYTITPGVLGINIEPAYTGTFDISSYTLALGTGGLDATGATSATIDEASGSIIAIEGDTVGTTPFNINDTTFQLNFPDIIFNGNITSDVDTSAVFTGNNFIVGVGADVSIARFLPSTAAYIWGTLDLSNGLTMLGRQTYLYDGGEITGSGTYIARVGDLVSEAGGVVSINTAYLNFSAMGSTGTGTLYPCTWRPGSGSLLLFQSATSGYDNTATFAAGTHTFDCDLQFQMFSTNTVTHTMTLDAATNSPTVELTGEFTYAVDADVTRVINASGQVNLTGTADQDIDTTDFATKFTYQLDKTAGVVTLTAGDFTLSEDSGTIVDGGSGDYSASIISCDGIVLDAAYTDTLDLNGFDLVVGTSGLDASLNNGGTIDRIGGDFLSRGDVIISDNCSWSTSAIILGGGGLVILDGNVAYRSPLGSVTNYIPELIIASGATANITVDNHYFRTHAYIYGTLSSTQSLRSSSAGDIIDKTITVYSGGVISAPSSLFVLTANKLAGDPSGIDVNLLWVYCGLRSSAALPAGTYNSPIQYACGGTYLTDQVLDAGTYTFNEDFDFITNNASAATTVELDISMATVNLAADLTVDIGVYSAEPYITGNINLTGAANQAIVVDSVTGLPTYVIAKSAGVVTIAEGDFTLSGNSGTIVDGGSGDYSGSTIGCDGIVLDPAYTDTFALNGYDLVVGSSGIDASTNVGGTIDRTGGDVVSRGDIDIAITSYWSNASLTGGLVILDGTLAYNARYDGTTQNYVPHLVIAQGAVVSTTTSTHFLRTAVDIYGDWTLNGTLNSSSSAIADSAVTVYSSGSLNSSAPLVLTRNVLAGDPSNVNVSVIQVYTGARTISALPAGTYNQPVVYYTGGAAYTSDQVLSAGTYIFDDFTFVGYADYGAPASRELDISAATVNVTGDLTVGPLTYNTDPYITGTVNLTGTGTQTLSVESVAGNPTYNDLKASGTLVFSGVDSSYDFSTSSGTAVEFQSPASGSVTIEFPSNFTMGNTTLNLAGAGTLQIDTPSSNLYAAGNITTSGATGTIAITDELFSTGTANQVISITGNASAPGWNFNNKTAGSVTFSQFTGFWKGSTSGTITLSGTGDVNLDSNIRCANNGGIEIDVSNIASTIYSGFTGTFDFDSYRINPTGGFGSSRRLGPMFRRIF